MATIKTTDGDFSTDVLQAEKPVLVDFWAEWCGPCKQIGPILEEISSDYEGKLSVVKVNIDENPEIPTNYGIMSIPTLILFKNGKSVSSQIGLVEKSSLTKWLDENL